MGETSKFLLNVVALLVIAGTVLRLTMIEVVTVRDNGMAPTLIYGDEVLVWKGASADMANVMVCEHPARRGEQVIGRAVVFAGHGIHTDRNGLYVDRDQTTQQIVERQRFYDATRRKQYDMDLGEISYFGKHDHQFYIDHGERFSMRETHVDKGVFLLGDNRAENQFDSREFGVVDPAHCLGQVFLRWKPAPDADDDIRHRYLDTIQ